MNDLDSCERCGTCQRCEAVEREVRRANKPPKRRLKIEWTTEMADDLEAFHGDRGPFLTLEEPFLDTQLGGANEGKWQGLQVTMEISSRRMYRSCSFVTISHSSLMMLPWLSLVVFKV